MLVEFCAECYVVCRCTFLMLIMHILILVYAVAVYSCCADMLLFQYSWMYVAVIVVIFGFRNYLLLKPLLYCIFSDCSYIWVQKSSPLKTTVILPERIKNYYLNLQMSAGWGVLLNFSWMLVTASILFLVTIHGLYYSVCFSTHCFMLQW
jgi:hypothetical protein